MSDLAEVVEASGHLIESGLLNINMLPSAVRTVCVDINPAVVTKLADRGRRRRSAS